MPDNLVTKTSEKFSFSTLYLLVILIVAAILRFHKLGMQSMGFDELQTMLDIDPNLSLSGFYHMLVNNDSVHPPFYFILQRIFSYFFDYNEFYARALSALAGTASVYAIFLLGKEIKNKMLGLIAATFMCVNYFNIYYSQEARMYSFLLLFSTLSYLYFLRIFKHFKIKNILLFIIFTIFLIYTHYYGFLVVISELILTFFFLVQEKEKRRKLFITLLFSEAIIAISYIPWLHRLLASSEIHGGWWNSPVKWYFFAGYFNEYFGGPQLAWIATAMLAFYFFKVCTGIKGFKSFRSDSLFYSVIFLLTSLATGWGIPYMRSVMVVPMLEARYTIIVLPSIIIALAYAIEIIPNNVVRYSVLGIFTLLSLYNLVLAKKYYRTITKADFRAVTKYITSNNQNYSIINPPSPELYYFKKDNFKGRLYMDLPEHTIDSILQKTSRKYDIDTFWIVGFYNNPLLPVQKEKDLDTAYAMIKDTVFFGGFAELYVRCIKNTAKTIDYTYFNPEQVHNHGELVVAIWSDASVSAKPISLGKGRYKISIQSEGTPVSGVYPHNNLYINSDKIGDFYSGEDYRNHTFYYELKLDTMATIKVDMDNDVSTKNEDRNTFIRKVYILKMKN